MSRVVFRGPRVEQLLKLVVHAQARRRHVLQAQVTQRHNALSLVDPRRIRCWALVDDQIGACPLMQCDVGQLDRAEGGILLGPAISALVDK